MVIRALIGGSIIMAIGIFMVIKALKKTAVLKQYANENRDSYGVVHFDSQELSRIHSANKNLYIVIGITGFFVGFFGVIIMGYGFNL
ncbi:MAG: hypothetical protein L3J69_06170 [Desulfobacula sp.]|nr:hypothetical protein [Desulfobacula sp.]